MKDTIKNKFIYFLSKSERNDNEIKKIDGIIWIRKDSITWNDVPFYQYIFMWIIAGTTMLITMLIFLSY